MSDFLRLAVLLTAIVNPARLAGTVSFVTGLRGRAATLIGGAAATLTVTGLLAVLAGRLLDFLHISPETFRIAAGAIVLVGALALLIRGVSRWPDLQPGPRRALLPVAFPVLLAPEVVAAATSYGADEGAPVTTAALAIAYGVCVVSYRALAGRPAGIRVGVERLAAVVATAAGLALVVSGILDV